MNREQIKSTLKIAYVALSLVTIIFLLYKRPEPVAPPPPPPAVDKQYEETIRQLENQTKQLEAMAKQLEKRHQSQIEFNKRLCEYIVVITVEKKILPRQCQPNFEWAQ